MFSHWKSLNAREISILAVPSTIIKRNAYRKLIITTEKYITKCPLVDVQIK